MESNTDKIRRSNREAARLVADMFSVLSTSAVALFPSETEASEARVKWGSSFKGQIFSIDTPSASKGMGNLYSKRISSQEQEQALLGTDGVYIPEGTQIIIVAGPRPKDIKKLKKIHDRLGQDTLIVFINARASIAAVSTNSRKSIEAEGEFEAENIDWVTGAFTTVFHYAPPLITSVSSDSAATEGNLKRDLLLYHEFGGDWYLAEKEVNEGIFGSGISLPSITGNSGFKTIWEGKDRPGKIDIINLLKF